jgi:uncharacterized protein YjbI with pentapeptide repeats
MAGPLDDDPLIPPPDAPAVLNHTPAVVWTSPWRFTPGRDALVVIAKLTCRLVPGGPCEPLDEPAPPSGDVHWDDDPAASLAYASDFAPHKPRADVTLTGHAYPRGDDRTVARVRLQLGDVDRVITATGDRAWTALGLRGPAPFESLPLRWERAYGGAGHPTNPVGIGAETASDNPLGRLANLEDPRYPVASSVERPRPACLAPLAPAWAPRASQSGTFTGDAYRARWPLLPDDFDYGYFNAAPPEQQTRHLRGDEGYLLGGVHPELAAIAGTLPAKRPRVYAERRPGAGGEFYELRLALDTVHFMPDALEVVLVWRGAVEVVDPWGSDLLALHVLSVAHDEVLTPEAARARAHALRARGDEEPDAEDAAPSDPADDPRVALAAAGAVGVPVLVAPAEPPPPAAFAREDIEALLARGESLAGHDLTESDLAGLDLAGLDLTGAVCERASFAGARLDGATLAECVLAGADLSGASLRGAVLERADLTDARLAGADFTESTITEATLARCFAPEVSFRGAKGEGADFTEATLTAGDFRGAALPGADFTLARVERADFSEAALDDARMNECWAAAVVLERASLVDFRAEGADLKGARIAGARADGALFQASRLDGARFDGCSLAEAIFTRSVLDGASFARASAVEADFRRARMHQVALLRANLMKARFAGADLTRADLRGANLHEAELREARVEGADWSLAIVHGSGLDPQ